MGIGGTHLGLYQRTGQTVVVSSSRRVASELCRSIGGEHRLEELSSSCLLAVDVSVGAAWRKKSRKGSKPTSAKAKRLAAARLRFRRGGLFFRRLLAFHGGSAL